MSKEPRQRYGRLFGVIAFALLLTPFAAAGDPWLDFVKETSTRLIADPELGVNDDQEKDYAWGDVDQDGDTDLIVVRKEPFTTEGRRVNVLLINEDGILVDRTSEYASASDIPNDDGFNTPINDRDVILVDVNGDTLLDIVTAVTLSDGAEKHISHPRVYRNLGHDPQGNWLGYIYEDARIPVLGEGMNGSVPHSPRFCSVTAGDVTGDGYPDLYFGDYDNAAAAPPMTFDFNNRLLINDGNGFFTDETAERLPPLPGEGLPGSMRQAAFGAASEIHDMNNDGVLDIVKQTSLNPPQHVAINYNDPQNEGFFNIYDIIYDETFAPYFFDVGDLNNDGMLDMVVVDDGADRIGINQGNDANGVAHFTFYPFLFEGLPEFVFGGNALIVDLDQDGWNDAVITDVDVDIPGCARRTHVYQNQANPPFVDLVAEAFTPNTIFGQTGVHDVAVFDIDNDGDLDLIYGLCAENFLNEGTQIWINQAGPPAGTPFLRGDADGDQIFNALTDALFTLSFGFVPGSATPPCLAAVDADGDNVFNALQDALQILNFGFVPGSAPIPSPFPECGLGEDTVEALGCLTACQ